jgi:hypothetical protein
VCIKSASLELIDWTGLDGAGGKEGRGTLSGDANMSPRAYCCERGIFFYAVDSISGPCVPAPVHLNENSNATRVDVCTCEDPRYWLIELVVERRRKRRSEEETTPGR